MRTGSVSVDVQVKSLGFHRFAHFTLRAPAQDECTQKCVCVCGERRLSALPVSAKKAAAAIQTLHNAT